MRVLRFFADWPGRSPTGLSARSRSSRARGTSPFLFVAAAISLTGANGYHLYDQPRLAEGTQAPQTIRAPYDLETVDKAATEAKLRAARDSITPVLQLDPKITQQIRSERDSALAQLQRLRLQVGPFPYADESAFSLQLQADLRRRTEQEWQAIVASARKDPDTADATGDAGPPAALRRAIAQLRRQRQQLDAGEYRALIEQISSAREAYAAAAGQIAATRVAKLSAADKQEMLDLSDEVWEEAQQGLRRASERVLAQGIAPGLPPELLTRAVQMQLAADVPAAARSLTNRVLLGVLRPNLSEDREQMILRAESVADTIEPVTVSVRRGEDIVRSGEAISRVDFVLLDAFELSRRGVNWAGLAALGGAVTIAVGGFYLIQQRVRPRMRQRDRVLVLLLSLSTPLLAIVGVSPANLPAIGLLSGGFYGPVLATSQVLLLAGVGLAAALLGAGGLASGWIPAAIATTAGGVLAAIAAGRLRSREELALLGSVVGLAQGSTYLAVALAGGAGVLLVLPGAVISGLTGLAWCVVALGISPYLERVFDLVTPIRLAELANPNRPLLQRLAIEAPGTFQHTLFVASLAEAAARELHCNVELVRAGTLYHDIGKMHDPLGFIENQIGCSNKHDEIADPHVSASIIKRHVSEGLAMARKHGLPRSVRDFIPEHQGTLLISYFYFQAQQRAQQAGLPSVCEADFRYDGPAPQSRETGLVMLADGCEAALRSLKEATQETALAIVNKILRARWQDGQLVDSGLQRNELARVAEVFVCVWQQSNHRRIAYPKSALEPRPARPYVEKKVAAD
ncbi:putative domain protein HDIG [Rubidibacter lacunae KORDI 51-2]|uniref:Putative domain protein HDIG n=1 Tax=Rubidibacter lacunae KORDI 51-2 TaxID=582515 RepID=U5DG91_9CHRO|nr:HDIG domain-containing metalloprotein [Rubidibacter lacunae]ERN40292.1 putative domain protein HDIG [Rubidibacter lacunae KORDI 51-2]